MLPTPQSKNNGAVLILGTNPKPQFPLEVLQWQGAKGRVHDKVSVGLWAHLTKAP
jgi:hypothetical protein